jgi:hypothetical protein
MLSVDRERCPSDTLDAETIVIDGRTGRVYVFSGVASIVWDAAVVGVERSAVDEAVARRYGAAPATLIGEFVDRLADLGLLVERDGNSSAPLADADWPDEFVAPAIEEIDDVADIITLDPIHEVDPNRGWPSSAG